MRSLLPYLACLMLLLTGLAGAAHAAEAAGGTLGGVTLSIHSDGDGDEAPADADSTVPHHHGACHGHDTAEPVRCVSSFRNEERGTVGRSRHVAALDGTRTTVTPRPPQA
jgi:hypothetical protein